MFINLGKNRKLDISAGKTYFMLDNQIDKTENKIFDIPEDCVVNYIFIINSNKKNIISNLEINLIGIRSKLDLKVLFVGNEGSNISSKINVCINASNNCVDFNTVSLLLNKSSIDLDAGIIISPRIINSEGNLMEENIVLGNNIKIKTLPLLDIHSDNIKASHAAKVHGLDKEKLFYLHAKGIKPKDAKKIFVEAYINKIFEKFEDIDVAMKLKKDILENIIL